MLPLRAPCRSLAGIILLSITSCSSLQTPPLSGSQTTPLSVPAKIAQTGLTAIPQPAPECSAAARMSYKRLEGIFDQRERGQSDRQGRALDRQILASLGQPRYAKHDQDNGTTYEWLSPDCPGWYIRASFDAGSYALSTAEIPPPVATFPTQDAASDLQYTLVGHPREVKTVTIAPDGQTLISGSADGQIHFWQLSNGKHLRKLKPDDWVTHLRVSPDGKTLMSLGSELTTWNLATGALIKELELAKGGSIHNFFSPDKHFLVSTINNERVNLWQIKTQKQVASFSQPRYRTGTLALHPQHRILADAQYRGLGANQNPILLWDLFSGKKLQRLSGHASAVLVASFSPDGRILATGGTDSAFRASQGSQLRLWDWQKGILVRTLVGQKSEIRALVFSANGQRLATGSGNGKIDLWHVQTGQHLQTFVGHTHPVIALTFDATGRRLVSGSDDRTVKVWQLN